MKKPSVNGWLILVPLVLLPTTASANWVTVAPGIDYREFTLSDPNNLFVARLDRSNTGCIIDSCIAQGRLISGRETVSSMANGHEDVIGYWGQFWGQRYDVVAAINGDFFNLSTGVPTSGQIASGWYAKRFNDFAGGSGFAWQLDRDVFIGECVRHRASKQKVAYPATGNDQNISGVNRARGTDELIVYTHHYNLTTATDNSGAEVLVEMTRPTLILPLPAFAQGTVKKIRPNQGASLIPFDHIVLSAHGSAATKLLNNVNLGDEIQISQEITHYESDCSTPLPLDWTKTYASIGGSFYFLKGGVVQTFTDPGATTRHPRTAVAYNSNYVFFIVVDGRSAQSVGMTMTELGNFCLTYLSATHGINQDGGGSSTMWVNGEVKNVPSDGTERPVANGLMMIVVQPKAESVRFDAGNYVRSVVAASVRVGPGVNYAPFTSVAADTVGIILDHTLKGVSATGDYWWKCEFAGTAGWLPEDLLAKGAAPGDLDADGDVDLGDFTIFADCLNGPEVGAPPTGCDPTDFADADLDGDTDVDLEDFGAFSLNFTGP